MASASFGASRSGGRGCTLTRDARAERPRCPRRVGCGRRVRRWQPRHESRPARRAWGGERRASAERDGGRCAGVDRVAADTGLDLGPARAAAGGGAGRARRRARRGRHRRLLARPGRPRHVRADSPRTRTSALRPARSTGIEAAIIPKTRSCRRSRRPRGGNRGGAERMALRGRDARRESCSASTMGEPRVRGCGGFSAPPRGSRRARWAGTATAGCCSQAPTAGACSTSAGTGSRPWPSPCTNGRPLDR